MTQMPPPPQYMPPQGGYIKPHRGTTVLVLGILGLVVCGICGIFAWTMGNADLREMDAGVMDRSGRDMTNIGRILGMVACGFMILGVLIFLLWMVVAVVFAGAAAASGSHSP